LAAKDEFIQNFKYFVHIGCRIQENNGVIPGFNFKMSSTHQPLHDPRQDACKTNKRCFAPSIYPMTNTLYINDQIHIEMNYRDTEMCTQDMGFKPLNDQNTENYKAIMMGQPGMIDPTMPPPEYDKAFIRYTLNNDMIPNYYNGVKGDSGKISIEVQDIPQNKIRIAAVVCRPGYADSEIVVRYFNKGYGKKPEKEYIERGKDEAH
jgi:hypothetical protein